MYSVVNREVLEHGELAVLETVPWNDDRTERCVTVGSTTVYDHHTSTQVRQLCTMMLIYRNVTLLEH